MKLLKKKIKKIQKRDHLGVELLGTVDATKTIKKVRLKDDISIDRINARISKQGLKFQKLFEEHSKKLEKLGKKHQIDGSAIHKERIDRLNEFSAIEQKHKSMVKKINPLIKRFNTDVKKLDKERSLLDQLISKVESTLTNAEELFKIASSERENSEELLNKVIDVVKAGNDVSTRSQTELQNIKIVLQRAENLVNDVTDAHNEMEIRFTEQETDISRQMIWIMDQKNLLSEKEDEIKVQRNRLRTARELTRKQYGKS